MTKMSKWFQPPAEFDAEVADELVWGVWRDAGLTETTTRWGERIAADKVGVRLRSIFMDKFTVEDLADLKEHPERAAWDVDVAEEFFPGVRLLIAPASKEEEKAAEVVVSTVWGYTTTSLTGALNLAIAADGFFVLEKTVVKKRPAQGRNGGIGIPRPGRFLTDDYELLRDLALDRDILKFKRAAERLESALRNHGDRRPEYRLAIARHVGKDLPAITGSLAHANPKAIAALEAESKAAANEPTPGSETGDEGVEADNEDDLS